MLILNVITSLMFAVMGLLLMRFPPVDETNGIRKINGIYGYTFFVVAFACAIFSTINLVVSSRDAEINRAELNKSIINIAANVKLDSTLREVDSAVIIFGKQIGNIALSDSIGVSVVGFNAPVLKKFELNGSSEIVIEKIHFKPDHESCSALHIESAEQVEIRYNVVETRGYFYHEFDWDNDSYFPDTYTVSVDGAKPYLDSQITVDSEQPYSVLDNTKVKHSHIPEIYPGSRLWLSANNRADPYPFISWQTSLYEDPQTIP